MKADDFYQKTSCPYCMIGFPVFRDDKGVTHVDIIWSSEAGQMFKCQDPETLDLLTREGNREAIFKDLNDRFHKDASPFTKENIKRLDDFFGLAGEFLRYSSYMDDRSIREDIDPALVTKQMYGEGKNLKEVIDAITEINKDE